MPRQFDVFRIAGGPLVAVIQSDLLEAMHTRVVVPLLPVGTAGRPPAGLNPTVVVGGETVVLMPQLAATLTLAELGQPVGSIVSARDAVIRALDMLVSGV